MPYNILLVDDDPEFREEFCDCFSEYNIIQAGSGEQAKVILDKPNEIDLVMLDVMMPDVKGTELLADLKAKSPDLSVVIMTGHGSKDIAVDALKGKADDYIEKPINIKETGEIIKSLLDKADSGGPDNASDVGSKIERVKKFLERNFHKIVSLEDAASVVGLSPKYLSRVFEEQEGRGFSEYKTAVKINKSKDFLRHGHNINQITDMLGYQNAETFIRAFKKVAGMTPKAYSTQKKKAAAKKKKAAGKKGGASKQSRNKNKAGKK